MADHPLRRWKRFLAAFGAIDAAIEAAGPDISRDEFRRARCVLVERLCDASDEDERDELCGHLDTAMVQSLLTLQMVPVAPAMLARTELVPAVRRPEAARVRAERRRRASRVSESSGSDGRGVSSCIDGKIEASKRRLREGYREEEDAKRQRKIQVIKAPDMVVVRDHRKQHPIMRERSGVRCASSVKVRRG
ncbi:hypothetical protein HU200_025825 [Digitaria exilis]|uniref:Uncharacterized protein n=1 Tax=Digitaria exilis TaxID=1010633 RepID=A0A835C7K1_9POAL|nr:hypothetical protein HU200_025825 [Digitaria exilis]